MTHSFLPSLETWYFKRFRLEQKNTYCCLHTPLQLPEQPTSFTNITTQRFIFNHINSCLNILCTWETGCCLNSILRAIDETTWASGPTFVGLRESHPSFENSMARQVYAFPLANPNQPISFSKADHEESEVPASSQCRPIAALQCLNFHMSDGFTVPIIIVES